MSKKCCKKLPQTNLKPQKAGRLIGYARVSTEDQDLGLQIAALEAAGVPRDQIFADKRSGVDDKRPGLAAALKGLFEGDTFVVWKIDRMARSASHLYQIVDHIEKRGAELRILSPEIDTRDPAGRLLFGIMGVMAEFERNLISERTKAGIARKKALGQWKGRPLAITPAKWKKAQALIAAEPKITLRALAEEIEVSPETVRRFYDAIEAGEPHPSEAAKPKK